MATDITDTAETHTVDEDGRVSVDGVAHVVQDLLYTSRHLIAREISETAFAHLEDCEEQIATSIKNDPEDLPYIVEEILTGTAQDAARGLSEVWMSSGRDHRTELAYRIAQAITHDVIADVWRGAYLAGHHDGTASPWTKAEERVKETPSPYDGSRYFW